MPPGRAQCMTSGDLIPAPGPWISVNRSNVKPIPKLLQLVNWIDVCHPAIKLAMENPQFIVCYYYCPTKTSMCRVSQCFPVGYVWLLKGKFAGQAMQKAKEKRIEHHKNTKLPPLRALGWWRWCFQNKLSLNLICTWSRTYTDLHYFFYKTLFKRPFKCQNDLFFFFLGGGHIYNPLRANHLLLTHIPLNVWWTDPA